MNVENKLHYLLRLVSAMCFIGHGAFGIITKQIWCNYFAVFGIGHNMAYNLMPWLGSVDILMGLSLLFYPTRAVLTWLVIWGITTALLRPLSGEPFAEFIERAGNFGAPLVLLMSYTLSKNTYKGLFTQLTPNLSLNVNDLFKIVSVLQIIVFLIFAGHGRLNLIGKKSLLTQYASIGFASPRSIAQFVGLFEIGAAFTILFYPQQYVLTCLLVWKVVSELFYPHYELLEWIERGGSYGVVLALWFAVKAIPPSYGFISFFRKKRISI